MKKYLVPAALSAAFVFSAQSSGRRGILRRSRRHDKKVHRGRHEADHPHRRQSNLRTKTEAESGIKTTKVCTQ